MAARVPDTTKMMAQKTIVALLPFFCTDYKLAEMHITLGNVATCSVASFSHKLALNA